MSTKSAMFFFFGMFLTVVLVVCVSWAEHRFREAVAREDGRILTECLANHQMAVRENGKWNCS